jgi:ligand-binding SRPBCC domain-containing protein
MPLLELRNRLPCGAERAFALFLNPARLASWAPAELGVTLVSAPEVLALGSRTVARGRRWGISREVEMEVTALEPGRLLVEEQVRGPFRRLVHQRRFAELEGEQTEVVDRVEYEPPGGLLGLQLTPRRVERDFVWVIGCRNDGMAQLLRSPA